MSDALRARLFTRFEQADGSARQHGGSGLGLAICRELAQLMEGRIEVTSALGEGSTFNVELPLPQVAVTRLAAVAPSAASAMTPSRGLRVLLVEDDATVADVIVGLLTQLGHRAVHVPNGLAALTELKARAADLTDATTSGFDLALLDLDLPGIDGLQLARTIRAVGCARLPLIAVTARSVGDEEAQVRAAGMDALLRKPLTIALLRRAIDEMLAAGSRAGGHR